MDGWSRFLDAFFKPDLIERYFPAIMKGVVVTIEVAAAVVVTGIALGPAAPAQRADCRLRRRVPRAAAARSHIAGLFRLAECRD
jgi:ABC-type amino acid transport system permease subunit